jgi:hypothetical protein
MPNCSGGLILHVDDAIAGCTLDDDVDGCVGRDERHEDAPVVCWKWWGRYDRCCWRAAAASAKKRVLR